MFFFMLINLGLGSMIGTMTGITTPVLDAYKVQKELFTGTPLPSTTATLTPSASVLLVVETPCSALRKD